MNIAFFTYTILEHGGGLEKYFIDTSIGLKKNFPELDISIITLDEKMSEKLMTLLSFFYFKKIDKNNIYKEKTSTIIKRLKNINYIKCNSFRSLKEQLNKFDVIYSKNEVLEGFILKFLIGYRSLPPIIFGVHTPHFYPIAQSFYSKFHNYLYSSKFYNFLSSEVWCFQTNNKESFNIIKKQFPKKKVVNIYYPFDSEEFRSKSMKNKYDFNFDSKKFNIIFSGRLAEQKGIKDLIYIIESINKTIYNNKIIWNICGDGIYKNKVLKLKDKWKNINYHGHVANEYIGNILIRNNLFISTSKWEVLPFNIIEALSSEIPVIAFNIAGPNDLIENNKNGLLVESVKEFIKSIKDFVDGKYVFRNISKNINKKLDPKKIYNSLYELFKICNEEN